MRERERVTEKKMERGGGGEKVVRWGYPVTTISDRCISFINSYFQQAMTYGRERGVILEAAAEDPDCVLANALAASFYSPTDLSTASSFLTSATARLEHATSYEKAVLGSIASLMAENRDDHDAFASHCNLLKEFPRDLASLKRAQILCFYMGRPDLSLQLVEQVLPQNQNENYIYGMLAFPLLELGRMADAENAAKKGLDINKEDLWSQHCLCHVLQYDCRFKEAVDFMEACSTSWNSCSSFMYTHNWWHVAVCYLEGHSPIEKVLKVYDHHIWNELLRNDADCGAVYLNALGLLLRVFVRGKMSFIENRLKILVECLTDQSNWHKEWLLDLLALWALSCIEETRTAEELLKSIKSRISSMSKKKQKTMQRGILLAEAMYEYGRENYERVFKLLGPDFDANQCKMIGASDEQIDVFDEVWYIILLNTGRVSKAIEEIEKRVKKREGIPFLWQLLEKGYSVDGRGDASFAAERAKALEAAYFQQ